MRHSRGLKRCQSEVWGRVSRAGRQVDLDRAPTHRPVLAGAERMEWAVGPEETASVPNPPRRPRAASQTLQRVKFPVTRGAGARGPGAGELSLTGGYFKSGGGGGEHRPVPQPPPAFRV